MEVELHSKMYKGRMVFSVTVHNRFVFPLSVRGMKEKRFLLHLSNPGGQTLKLESLELVQVVSEKTDFLFVLMLTIQDNFF